MLFSRAFKYSACLVCCSRFLVVIVVVVDVVAITAFVVVLSTNVVIVVVPRSVLNGKKCSKHEHVRRMQLSRTRLLLGVAPP